MKKFIVMMAVVAFSALAFGEDAPKAPDAGAPATTGDSMKSGEGAMKSETTTETKTTKKMAKKGKHKKAKSEDKAM